MPHPASQLITERHHYGPIPPPDPGYRRADLEIYGINHFRPSFTGLVFLNDPDVSAESAHRSRPSFAGSFSIFGHQTCVGDPGHCEIDDGWRRFDDRPSHPLTRAFKRLIVTEALRRVSDEPPLSVTIVVAAVGDPSGFDGPLFDITGIQVATFA